MCHLRPSGIFSMPMRKRRARSPINQRRNGPAFIGSEEYVRDNRKARPEEEEEAYGVRGPHSFHDSKRPDTETSRLGRLRPVSQARRYNDNDMDTDENETDYDLAHVGPTLEGYKTTYDDYLADIANIRNSTLVGSISDQKMDTKEDSFRAEIKDERLMWSDLESLVKTFHDKFALAEKEAAHASRLVTVQEKMASTVPRYLNPGKQRFEYTLHVFSCMCQMLKKEQKREFSAFQLGMVQKAFLSCAPKIYGDFEWDRNKIDFYERYNMPELLKAKSHPSRNMAITPRRFGKTSVTAAVAATLVLAVPGFTVTTYSIGQRTATMLLDLTYKYVTSTLRFMTKNSSLYRIVSKNASGLMILPVDAPPGLNEKQKRAYDGLAEMKALPGDRDGKDKKDDEKGKGMSLFIFCVSNLYCTLSFYYYFIWCTLHTLALADGQTR